MLRTTISEMAMQRHSKSSKSSRQPTEQSENHSFYFQGCWMPPLLYHHATAPKKTSRLNGTDLAVFVVVTGLFDPKWKGCWASNGWIAERINTSPKQVQRSISRLIEFQLLEWAGEHPKTKRILRTPWALKSTIPTPHPDKKCPGGPGQKMSGDSKRQDDGSTSSAASSRRSKKAEKSMLLDDIDIRPKSKAPAPAQIDYEYADRLYNAVRSAGKRTQRSWSRKSWAQEFRRLHDEEVNETYSGEVLDWFCAHIGQEYVPQTWSAKSFRLEFSKVEAAMERDRKRNPVVTVSANATKIVNRIKHLHWPKGSATQLPIVVQLSIDKIQKFRKHLLNRVMPDSPLASLSGKVRAAVRAYEHVIEVYLKNNVYRRIAHWEKWNGNLIPYAWSPQSESVMANGRELAKKFTGKSENWDKLLKEIE